MIPPHELSVEDVLAIAKVLVAKVLDANSVDEAEDLAWAELWRVYREGEQHAIAILHATMDVVELRRSGQQEH